MADQEGLRVAKAYMEITTNVDSAMAETTAKIRAAARDIEKGGNVAGESLDKGMADGVSKGSQTEKSARDKGTKAGDEFVKGSSETIGKDRSTEDAAEKVAKRAQSKFSALQFGGFFAGLPAAAAVAGAGVAAGLAVAPLAFAGLAAAALKSNVAVATAATSMSEHVTSSVTAMAQPLEGTMVLALGRLGVGFDRLAPQIGTAMHGSGAALLTFEDGVIGLAENAMPGLVTAVQHSQAPMEGLRSLLLSAGTGASDFFRNLSQGAQSSQGILTTTGSIIKDLEGFAGALFANLSNSGGPALTSFRQALSTVESTLLTVTSAGSPVLGFLQGFTTSVSGGMSVVQGLVGLLNLLPPGFSQLAGSTFAVVKVLDTFGVSAKSAFDGFGTAIANAEGARGKFSAGLTGLASAALNPVTLATAGLSIGLMALGQEQEKAAKAAQIHDSYLQSLTTALRASGGAIDDSVRAQAAQALSNTKVADTGTSVLAWAQSMHLSLPLVTDAITGVPGALDRLHESINGYATSAGGSVQTADTFTAAVNNMAAAAPQATTALQNEAAAHSNAASSIQTQLTALLQLNDALLATADKDFAYEQAQTALQAAHDNVTQALKNKTSTTLQITQAEQGEEGAMLGLIRASEAKAAADYKGSDAGEKSRQTMAAAGIEALQLAGKYGGNLPASVSHYISSLDNAQLAAMGVTRSIDDFGNSVYRLPDGKVVTLHTNADDQANRVNNLANSINALHDKNVMITVSERGSANAVSQTGRPTWNATGNILKPGGVAAFASGGMANLTPMAGGAATVVPPNTWRVVGDNMKVPEAYIPIDFSARSLDLLAKTNQMMGSPLGGSAQSSGGGAALAAPAATGRQQAPNVTIHVQAPPGASSTDTAALVSSELSWLLRTR